MNHFLQTHYTFANEDYEAYINATIGAGPYQSIVFEGIFRIEQILQKYKIVYSSYETDDSIDNVEKLTKENQKDLTDKEEAFRLAYESERFGVEGNLAFRLYRTENKNHLQVIDVFMMELENKHGRVLVIFTSRPNSNYYAKIITKDLRALHLTADDLLREYFVKDRHHRASRKNPMLHLVKETKKRGLELAEVPLKMNRVMGEEALQLHYGRDIITTQKKLKHSLENEQCGLHLFQGAPGMGKTTFISHLCAELAGKHKLVYMPNSAFEKLISPEKIDFWAEACDDLKERAKIVLVVEDAEAILLRRERSDSHGASAVSLLLNLCDGLLGQMLGLHVIATANSDFQDFDEAILRAGRLKTRHVFQPLAYEAALKLAQYLEKPMPKSNQDRFTLAEIYNDSGKNQESMRVKRKIGFLSK